MVRFDAYSATTTEAKAPELLFVLVDAGGLGSFYKMTQGKGFYTFGERIGIKNE